jgi:hypothetical protein
MVARATAPAPLTAAMKTSFSQRAAWMSGGVSTANCVDRSYVRRIVCDLRRSNVEIALGTANVQSTSANRFQVRVADYESD